MSLFQQGPQVSVKFLKFSTFSKILLVLFPGVDKLFVGEARLVVSMSLVLSVKMGFCSISSLSPSLTLKHGKLVSGGIFLKCKKN